MRFFNFIHSLSGHSFWFDSAGIFFAEYLIYFLVLGALILIIQEKNWKKRWLFGSEMILAVILSRGLITTAIRFFYNHPRPFAVLNFIPLIPESGSSFPSGHAAALFALATIIFYFLPNWGYVYFAFATLNGLARVYVGVHWGLDILAGAVLGLASGVFIHWLFKKSQIETKKPDA